MTSRKIPRTAFTAWLDAWRDKDVIKVVSGIRRCGKTTLLELYREKLLAEGIPAQNIVSVNFEDPDVPQFNSFRDAWLYLKSKLPASSQSQSYLFLDEVQIVPEFERLVDGIFSKKICDLYITGSNAKFLSGELATFLTGRYVEITLQPLSFSEYCTAFPQTRPADLFPIYMRYGGFPLAATLPQTESAQTDYLSGILNTILFKDLIARHNLRDHNLLKRLVSFLFSNIGSLLSVNRIANTFKSDGFAVCNRTIDSYLAMICDSFLAWQVPRYDIRGREILKTNSKFYVADPGLRRILLGDSNRDIGHVLENLVFLELKRRYRNVYVGALGAKEVDFVAMDGANPVYVQVSLSVREESTFLREISPLRSIPDNHPKYLLTLDYDPPANESGILQLPILDFLLQTP